MTLARLSLDNLRRSPLRSALTVIAIALSLVAFLLIVSVRAGWTRQVEQTPNNRVVSRNRIGWSQDLPLHYASDIAQLPGVKQAMGGRWVEYRLPNRPEKWLEITAVQAKPFVAMHYELKATAEAKQAFLDNRRGVWVSRLLAQELGWKVGETIHLKEMPSAEERTFEVVALFESTRYGFAQRALWVHWEYINDLAPPENRNKLNIVSAEINDPSQGANIARAIDQYFDAQDIQTYTQEDQALNASFVGMAGALLAAMALVAFLILGVVLLIVGNTISMCVRERTAEYGMLRALGFGTRHLCALVVLEAACLGLCGGILGVLIAHPLSALGLGRYLEETINLPPLVISLDASLVAICAGTLLACLAGLIPALNAARVNVVETLRYAG